MEEESLKKIKRKETLNRIVFVILCVLIAILLVSNIIMISSAYFTATKSTTNNPSVVTTGSVDVDVIVYNASDTGKSNPLTTPVVLPSTTLIPGNAVDYTFTVANSGHNNCYIRLKCDFNMQLDGSSTYEEVYLKTLDTAIDSTKTYYTLVSSDYVAVTNPTLANIGNYYENIVQMKKNPSGSNASSFFAYGGYIYYNTYLTTSGGSSSVDIPLRFVVSTALGNSNGETDFTDCAYKINITVEAIQSQGVTFSTTTGWAV